MSKNTLFVLIVLQILNIFIQFIQVLMDEYIISIQDESIGMFYSVSKSIIQVTHLILFLVFLAFQKFWFIFTMHIVEFVLGFLATITLWTAMSRGRYADYTIHDSILVVVFWISITTCLAYIWTDRNNNSWLTLFGFSNAIIICINKIFYSDSLSSLLFIKIIGILPLFAILFYLIHLYKRKDNDFSNT